MHVRSEERSSCPVCGSGLEVIGTRERKVREGDGEVTELVIRRLRCGACKRIHHELPDILVPYKRYSAGAIEAIVEDDTGKVVCEESTIRRIKTWWNECMVYFLGVLASLTAKYGAVFSGRPRLKEIVRAVVNAHLWAHTRSAFLSGG